MPEAIDVISVFRRGTIKPVKFRYAGRTHKVGKVLYTWVTRDGNFPVYHFSVTTQDGERFHIQLKTYQMDWLLSAVDEAAAVQ